MAAAADASLQLLDASRFWIQRVLVPLMVLVGVVGNTVTVVVLTRKRMRCSTNVYLTALAVADVIYLLMVFVLSFSHYRNIHDRKYELYWRFFGLSHWLCDAASSASVWMTVSFTVERYIAVCHPIKGKVVCTESRAKSIVVIVTILCMLTTASTSFEYQLTLDESCLRRCGPDEPKRPQAPATGKPPTNITVHYMPNHNIVVTNGQSGELDHGKVAQEVFASLQPRLHRLANCSAAPHIIYVPIYPTAAAAAAAPNASNRGVADGGRAGAPAPAAPNATCCLKKLTIGTEYTSLGSNRTYKAAMYWFSAVGFGLLPMALIATFNCFLVRAVYRSHRRRRAMTNSQEAASMSNENRITVMLIGMVTLFLLCQTPTALFLILDNFLEATTAAAENVKLALGNVFNFLVTVNAACNFILYCALSQKYRATFRALFCERRRKRQDTLALSSTRLNSAYVCNNAFQKNGLRRNVSEYRTPRNLEVTIYFFNKATYVNTYNLCMKV